MINENTRYFQLLMRLTTVPMLRYFFCGGEGGAWERGIQSVMKKTRKRKRKFEVILIKTFVFFTTVESLNPGVIS